MKRHLVSLALCAVLSGNLSAQNGLRDIPAPIHKRNSTLFHPLKALQSTFLQSSPLSPIPFT